MTVLLAGRSLSEAITEARRQPEWAVLGLRRNRSDAFEPWCSTEPIAQFLLQRLEQVWTEAEPKPPRAILPALILIAGGTRTKLKSPSLYRSLRDILDKLLNSDFHWWPGDDAAGILSGCFIRDRKTFDKTIAEVAKLRHTSHVAISESPTLSAQELLEAIAPQQDVMRQLQVQIASRIQVLLAPYAGRQPATIEDGQAICRAINDLVAAFGLRVQAPQVTIPSTIAYYRIARTKAGAFVFTGMTEGKRQVTYGSTVLPALTVVPAPGHGRRRPKTRRKKR